MPDLKTLLERESDRAQFSVDALDATLSRVRRRQRHRRFAAGVAGLAAFVPATVLAVWLGLSARHPAPARSPLATGPTSAPLVGRGTIAGRLTASGGPVGGLRPLPGIVTALPTGGTGTVRSRAKSYRAPVGPDGRYSISVPVGTYAVTGRSPLYQNGSRDCLARKPVVVTKGRVSRANVVCIEKGTD